MALTTSGLEGLFRQGRYAEILSDFDWRSVESVSQDHRVLLAHAAFHAGKVATAFDIATRENATTSSSGIRAECEAVIGLVHKRQADWRTAIKHFHASVHWAKDGRAPTQIGWSSLRLFRTLAEVGPTDALAALLTEVRKAVARAGDPHLTCYMHDSIALMEASAGRVEEARRHLRIAFGIIERHPNSWLNQVALISSFYLDFIEHRYAEALKHLRAARDLSSVVGEGFVPVIECNEGHLLLVTGHYDVAERHLRKVAGNDSPQFALAALDGLARLYLVAGRVEDCERALLDCESFSTEPEGVAAAFAGRRSSVTRIKLLQSQERHQEACSEADKSLVNARRVHDQMLVADLSFLKAESLARNGAIADAAVTVFPFASSDALSAAALQTSYYRTLAVILDSAGSELSKRAFERSFAIYEDQANECGAQELRQLQASLPTRTLGKRRDPIQAAISLTNALAAAFNVAHSKKLLGREVLNAIEILECSPKAEITTREGTSHENRRGGTYVLELGSDGGKAVTLSCEIPTDPLKATALADVLRIAEAVVSLNQAREEKRDRAALWPASPVESMSGALFISDEMQTLVATARRVATTNVPVLITGETGTGKEILARTIHAYSNGAKATFLPFNCTSTPKDMLDSQLFGHRRGSFTGATDNFQGIIRAAAGGTLFLDEIGDMGLDVQPKLLRFLESGEVHPIGETQPHRVDVRVIAATNANLDALVTDGRFREDLFYRLNIVRLHLPPLRERRVEIPAFASHYLQKYAQECGKGELRLAEETMEYLMLFRWPGNVRQLANEMRRMAALCEAGAVLMPEHLSPEIAASRRTVPASQRVLDPTEVVVRLDQPLAAATEHLQRALLQYALKQCGGRMEETATLLGLSRKGLYLKRQRFGIDPPDAPHTFDVA